MLESSIKRFKPAEIGDHVLVPIPDVDRAKIGRPQLTVVLDNNEQTGVFKLGTKHGELDQMFTRNQFAPIKEKFLTADDVPTTIMGIREASRLTSINGGQGMFKYTCNTKCLTNRCKCKKSGRIYNSRCHKNVSCFNHE